MCSTDTSFSSKQISKIHEVHAKEIDQLKAMYESKLKAKSEELQKFIKQFQEYHKSKRDQLHQARYEIVQIYHSVQKHHQVLEATQTCQKLPKLPDKEAFKFLATSLEKQKKRTFSDSTGFKDEDEGVALLAVPEKVDPEQNRVQTEFDEELHSMDNT